MSDNIEVLVAANREAWRLWGARGHAEIDHRAPDGQPCLVGILCDDASMEIRGRGRTFRAAFDVAATKVSA